MEGAAMTDEDDLPQDEAAVEPTPVVTANEARVLDALRATPEGLTDCEMEVMLDMGHSTLCPRRNSLVRKGLVKNSGLKRHTTSGNPAIVWIACVPGSGAPAVSASTIPPPVTVLPSPAPRIRRADFELLMDKAAPLFAQGKSNVEIAALVGVSTSVASALKKALSDTARVETKLDKDLDRFDAGLSSTAKIAQELARRLMNELCTKTPEELKQCGKSLSEALKQLRELQSVLKQLAQ